MVKRVVFALLLACLLLFAGCTPTPGESTPKQTLSASLGQITPVATLTQTATAAAASPTQTAGVTENRIGYVRKAYTKNGKNYIDIDYVQFLTGAQAVAAAKANGDAEQDENGDWFVPNDYYILNDSQTLRSFEVGTSASIRVLKVPGGADEFVSITFAKLKALGPTFADGKLLMHCNVANGIVVKLEEQYRP